MALTISLSVCLLFFIISSSYHKIKHLCLIYICLIYGEAHNNSNLPELVQMQNGNQIRYKYDVEGRKLQQTDIFVRENIDCPIGEARNLEDGQILKRNYTEYLGSAIYKNPDEAYPEINDQYKNLLHRINLTEGHIEVFNKNTLYEIKYHLKDHLGNIRAEVGLDNMVSNRTNYFPFGMAWIF